MAMAGDKFTRTQEKQYTAWVAHPPVGTHIPGASQPTTKDRPWVLYAPDGLRVVSAGELAANFYFKTSNGVEPINSNTAKVKVKNGIVDWTQVVRNTATSLSYMARHVAGKENGGLGWFEVYPEAYGPQYMRRVAGNAFVRMFALVGGLRGIASQAASEPITNKPKESIAVLAGLRKPKTIPTLPIPERMSADYAAKLSKFYADLRAEVKMKYNVDLLDGHLYNSGYLGLSFTANGHRFNVFNSPNDPMSVSSTDMKKVHKLSRDVDEGLAQARKILLEYFSTPRKIMAIGEKRDLGSKDYSKFENCVVAERLEDGVLLTVKPDVTQMDLLKFHGFSGDEAFFKYEGPFNKYGYHSMLVGFKSGKSWSYCWGTSTTMTSDITWRQTAVVLAAMEKLTGNLIYFTREFN